MNSQQMMEEIDRLARLCEAKDAENKKLRTALRGQTCFVPPEFQQQLSEAQAQIAMQADILIKIRSHDERAIIQKLIRNALSATSETVATWRANETEPLRKEVAMLRDAITFALVDIEGDAWIGILKQAVEDTQATALAYEREMETRGAVKALNSMFGIFAPRGTDGEFCIDAKQLSDYIDELRAAK